MNLISCDICGVVLDHDKLPYPRDAWNEDGTEIDVSKSEYNELTGEYQIFTHCPVCDSKIWKNNC